MEEIEYLHWEDMYRDTWINDYNSILRDKDDDSLSKDELYKRLVAFYRSTLYMILAYQRNNGYYYNSNMTILRSAFRIGFIEDGDGIMIINDMLVNPKNYNRDDVLNYCLRENFRVFEALNEKMAGLLGQQ